MPGRRQPSSSVQQPMGIDLTLIIETWNRHSTRPPDFSLCVKMFENVPAVHGATAYSLHYESKYNTFSQDYR